MAKIGNISIPPISNTNDNQRLAIQNTFNRISSQLDTLSNGSISASNSASDTFPSQANSANQGYAVGDFIRNTNPTVTNGQILLGWICEVAGNPGEWNPCYVSTGESASNYISNRNVIINGACEIAQRGTGTYNAGSGSLYSGPDRFTTANGAASGVFTQAQGTMTINGVTKQCVTQTVSTAVATSGFSGSNFWYGINQIVEGYNSHQLLGQPISVSFWFNSNVTGTFSVALRDGTAVNSFVTTFTAQANTPQYVTFTCTLPANLAIPQSTAAGLYVSIGFINYGNYQNQTNNQWISGNYLTTPQSTNWALAIGNFISVTELQVELGTESTPFEKESIALVLQKCMRYYQTLGTNPGIIYTNYNGAGGTFYNTTILAVPMRLSFIGPTGGPATSGAVASLNFNYSNASGGSVRYDFSTDRYIMTQATMTAAGSGFYYFFGTLSAEI